LSLSADKIQKTVHQNAKHSKNGLKSSSETIKKIPSNSQSINQWTNQPNELTGNQSINQPINQATDPPAAA